MIIFALPDWFGGGLLEKPWKHLFKTGKIFAGEAHVYFLYRPFGLKDAHRARDSEEPPISQILKK